MSLLDIFDFDKKMALINLDVIYEYSIKLDKLVSEDTELEEWVKMKLTRIEQNIADVKKALEGWEKFGEGGMIFKKQLLHIAKYSKELIEKIKDGSKLMSWQEDKLAVSAQGIDDIYHYLDYQMGNRASDLEKDKEIFADGGNIEVANTIIRQIGGVNRLIATTGAYNFIAIPNGVSFKIKNRRANYIKIKLTSLDLYDLEVGRIYGNTYNVVAEEKGLYADMLKPAIERATGMRLSIFENGGELPEGYDDEQQYTIVLFDRYDDEMHSYEVIGYQNVLKNIAEDEKITKQNREDWGAYAKVYKNGELIFKTDKFTDYYADGGDIEYGEQTAPVYSTDGYTIYEGYDFYNSKPIYRVESTSTNINEYVGEWHSNLSEAEQELDSLLELDYEEGGHISMPTSDIEKGLLEKVNYYDLLKPRFVGNFGWMTPNKKRADGYLFELDDYDKDLVSSVKLKEGERIFRYINRTTAIGGMTPLVKINVDRQLLYFVVPEEEYGDEKIAFETRGTKALWLTIVELGKYKNGGEVLKKGDRVTDGRGNVGVIKAVQDNGKLYIQWISYSGEPTSDLTADNDPEEFDIIQYKLGGDVEDIKSGNIYSKKMPYYYKGEVTDHTIQPIVIDKVDDKWVYYQNYQLAGTAEKMPIFIFEQKLEKGEIKPYHIKDLHGEITYLVDGRLNTFLHIIYLRNLADYVPFTKEEFDKVKDRFDYVRHIVELKDSRRGFEGDYTKDVNITIKRKDWTNSRYISIYKLVNSTKLNEPFNKIVVSEQDNRGRDSYFIYDNIQDFIQNHETNMKYGGNVSGEKEYVVRGSVSTNEYTQNFSKIVSAENEQEAIDIATYEAEKEYSDEWGVVPNELEFNLQARERNINYEDRTDFEVYERVYIPTLKKYGIISNVFNSKDGIPMVAVDFENGKSLKLPLIAVKKFGNGGGIGSGKLIIVYMKDGKLKTNLIDEDELDWYLKNTTVYKTKTYEVGGSVENDIWYFEAKVNDINFYYEELWINKMLPENSQIEFVKGENFVVKYRNEIEFDTEGIYGSTPDIEEVSGTIVVEYSIGENEDYETIELDFKTNEDWKLKVLRNKGCIATTAQSLEINFKSKEVEIDFVGSDSRGEWDYYAEGGGVGEIDISEFAVNDKKLFQCLISILNDVSNLVNKESEDNIIDRFIDTHNNNYVFLIKNNENNDLLEGQVKYNLSAMSECHSYINYNDVSFQDNVLRIPLKNIKYETGGEIIALTLNNGNDYAIVEKLSKVGDAKIVWLMNLSIVSKHKVGDIINLRFEGDDYYSDWKKFDNNLAFKNFATEKQKKDFYELRDKYSKGGGVGKKSKGDIGKSGTQYGYTLEEWEEMAKKRGLLVSPKQWWKSQEGKPYTDSFGRKKKIGQHSGDERHSMQMYGYLISNGLDLGSKIIPTSAKKYVEENNYTKYSTGGGVGETGNSEKFMEVTEFRDYPYGVKYFDGKTNFSKGFFNKKDFEEFIVELYSEGYRISNHPKFSNLTLEEKNIAQTKERREINKKDKDFYNLQRKFAKGGSIDTDYNPEWAEMETYSPYMSRDIYQAQEEYKESVKRFSKSKEVFVRENLVNGEIEQSKLASIIGHEPDYPFQIVGTLKLKKAYLRPYYKL